MGVRFPPACGHDGESQQDWLREKTAQHLVPQAGSREANWAKLWQASPFAALEELRERVRHGTLPWGVAALWGGYFLTQDLAKMQLVLEEVDRLAALHEPANPTSLKVMMAEIWNELKKDQAGFVNLGKFMFRTARSLFPQDDRHIRERRFACLLITQAHLIKDVAIACGDLEISARESACAAPTIGQLDLKLPPAPSKTPQPAAAEELSNVITVKVG
jgi:hypothetical protein